jgi:2-polyprenyl-3-methyl-5-hydroxy-6-metoxy-1,4-benzoquinol methylase
MPAPLRPDDPDFDISSDEDVRALLRAEEHHFWHRARNRLIVSRLRALAPRATVLDLGCGAGCVTAELARAGYDVTGLDGHPALLEVASRRAPGVSFVCHDLRTGPPSLPGAPYDVVSLFDVIEHLDEPIRILETAVALAKPGGLVVGTVPALMLLWSGIDEHSGHKMRYEASSLRALLDRLGGASVVEIVPFFRALVPIMLLQRRVVGRRGDAAGSAENLRVPPWPINRGLDLLSRAEEILSPVLGPLGIPGASLWFAMRKM